MKKNLLWKTILILVVLVVFVACTIGWPDKWTPRGVAQSITSRNHLGLDLRGGTHLILQVQVDDAVRADAERVMERLKDDMRAKNINYADISMPDPKVDPDHPDRIVITGISPDNAAALRDIVSDRLGPDYSLSAQPDNTYFVGLKPQPLNDIKSRAVTQAIETIRNRIDQLGVSEPVIEEHGLGQYQILVQLPGVDDPERVKNVMQSTAMLEIRQSLGGPYNSQQEAMTANHGMLPENSELADGRPITGRPTDPNAPQTVWYVVSRTSAITGRDLKDAQATTDEFNKNAVRFTLSADGGRRFAAFTRAHIQDSLAVVLDKKVQEVATIQDEIHDEGRITGSFTEDQAKDLATMLRSGALPAGIKYLEERTVGPSLGADSIRDGVRAAIIGMLAVLIFMLVYYKGAGVNADVALLFNLVILLGFMAFFEATLTLPGIAGVILTVGMGVDSNVLIFERIREELRNGKTPPSAVEQGFAHAWITIVDTHVTTIVSAAILFIFGTGPVKGFAVTLVFGLLANLFTAVFVSRAMFDAGLNRMQRGEALSI
jgi:preprotein translocase subunit SecD